MNATERFRDRRGAGRRLAELLSGYAGRRDVVVLALPRGGVPVAAEVAAALEAPLDVMIVRKLGLPGQPELAIGAIASGGVRVLNRELLDELSLPDDVVDDVAAVESEELTRRERLYRGSLPAREIAGRRVILVDDGVATGSTMLAAIEAARARGPQRVVVAVPVAAPEVVERLAAAADEVVAVATPEGLTAISLWYDLFPQNTDDEMRRLLEERARRAEDG